MLLLPAFPFAIDGFELHLTAECQHHQYVVAAQRELVGM